MPKTINRAPDDARMYLYFDHGPPPDCKLRPYVRLYKKGRRIGISDAYGTEDFDAAYKAAVTALGGVVKMRRLKPDEKPVQPDRRYLHADVSQRGQLRYYVQLRDKLPKIRIMGEPDSDDFNRAVDAAIADQIGKFGNGTDWINSQKQRRDVRAPLAVTPPKPGTLRWFWTHYKQSGHWLGCEQLGEPGLAATTRLGRTGLIEGLLHENGERSFFKLTRKVIKAEMLDRTPVQAGNLLSALRGLIRWMIAEEHLDEDGDPTAGIRSGKAKASRDSGGWVPWTDEDMARYRERWPLGTEARLMFDILHYTMLRVGDAHRFGQSHLKKMLIEIATEKSQGRTTVTVPVHPDFAASLRAARAAGILGDGEVFTGKTVRGKIVPMDKKSWAGKLKKYERLAGIDEPKKHCHGIRKARAEVAAYAECTEAQMMAMFGWTDPKMPALYIAKARRDKLGISGMAKMIAHDQSQNIDVFSEPQAVNKVVTFGSNRSKKL